MASRIAREDETLHPCTVRLTPQAHEILVHLRAQLSVQTSNKESFSTVLARLLSAEHREEIEQRVLGQMPAPPKRKRVKKLRGAASAA